MPVEIAPPQGVRLALSGLVVLQALAGAIGGPHLWGLHALAFLPVLLRIVWPLLALFVIWSPIAGRAGALIVRGLDAMLARRWAAYGIVPVAGMGIFWLLRCGNHFLGDGWLLGELVGRKLTFHGFDFNDYHLHARMFMWLGLDSEAQAFRLFEVMSVIAGGFYLAAAGWSARAVGSNAGERALIYGLLIFFTPLQIFMGYAETYSFLAVFMLLFLAALAAYYRGRLSIFWAALAFGGGLAFHLDALFLAPLLLAPLFWPAEGDRTPLARRISSIAFPVVALFAIAVLAMLLDGYNRQWFELDFVKTRTGQRLLVPLGGEHGLFSWRHWRDVLNLVLLLAPVPLALLALAVPRLRRLRAWPREVVIFIGGALWITVILALIHMKLGIARDWDLFAAQAAIYVFAAFLVWSRMQTGVEATSQPSGASRTNVAFVGRVILAAAFLALPYFLVNSSDARSLARFRAAIDDQPDFARAYGHEEIGKYFRKQDQTQEALAEYQTCIDIFPSNPRFHAVLAALQYNSGDHDAALGTFQRVYEVDSTYALGLEMLAVIYSEKENWERALFFSRKLAGDPREKARSAAIHGLAAEKLGLRGEAIDAYVRCATKDNTRLDLLERAGALALLEGDQRLAQALFRTVVEKHPTDTSRIGLIAALWQPLRQRPDSWRVADTRAQIQEALALAEDVLSRSPTNIDLIRWRYELRAALGKPRG